MSVEILKERLAASTAKNLPERVKYWATVEMYGMYLDKEGWTHGDTLTVAELISWADSPLAAPLKSGILFVMGCAKKAMEGLRVCEEEKAHLQRRLDDAHEALRAAGIEA